MGKVESTKEMISMIIIGVAGLMVLLLGILGGLIKRKCRKNDSGEVSVKSKICFFLSLVIPLCLAATSIIIALKIGSLNELHPLLLNDTFCKVAKFHDNMVSGDAEKWKGT